jgi:PKD repeat protein
MQSTKYNNNLNIKKMKKTALFILLAVTATLIVNNCKKDETKVEPVIKASFNVSNDAYDGLKANIKNNSKNATGYVWSFGDSTTSTTTDSMFSHTYKLARTYTIKLVATNGTKADSMEKEIAIPGKTFKQLLAGTDTAGKIWRLAFTGGMNMFNDQSLSAYWYGWDQLSAPARNTVRHHQYIFKPTGAFEFKTMGWTIRPGTIVTATSKPILFAAGSPDSRGWPDDNSWVVGGKDCSSWGNNANLTFVINNGNKYSNCKKGRIMILGIGGHLGPMDTGTETVVDQPANQTFYDVYSYGDGGTEPDTLVLYTPWGSNELGAGATREPLGIITLLSYKTDAQIPADE